MSRFISYPTPVRASQCRKQARSSYNKENNPDIPSPRSRRLLPQAPTLLPPWSTLVWSAQPTNGPSRHRIRNATIDNEAKDLDLRAIRYAMVRVPCCSFAASALMVNATYCTWTWLAPLASKEYCSGWICETEMICASVNALFCFTLLC